MNEKQKQFFELLGVQPEEYFFINGSPEYYWFTSKITLMVGHKNENPRKSIITLEDILCGDYKITKLPWTPINSEWYYYVGIGGKIASECFYSGNATDIIRARLGNCYKTKEEITPQIQKFWEKFFKSTERLKFI